MRAGGVVVAGGLTAFTHHPLAGPSLAGVCHLGMVSHDLRSPLGVVRLSVEGLECRRARGRLDEIMAAVPRPLQTVRVACQRMDRLIEDIFCLTKIEAGGLVAEPAPQRAELLVSEAIAQMEPLAEARQNLLAAVPPAAAGRLQVACDRDYIMQVFINLSGSAIKFSPARSRIEVAFWPCGGQVAFAVRDQGPGIAPQDLAYVSDRSWQAVSTQRHGADLGLAIVGGIEEAHGCEASVESVVGQGATFRFLLPQALPARPTAAGATT